MEAPWSGNALTAGIPGGVSRNLIDFDAATAAVRQALNDQGFGLDALKPVADEATGRLGATLPALAAA
ncbi:hypothetical protein E4N62_00455 [Streptomyces sp. MNU76]|uniref:hypothetical protein n=1 Tax=Streptomyces sp. MNU76 TaxID=2560026 RepID=UPI001E5DE835|nr:hypothetical protein [Streptomyces sp. MNU76]MCC9703872.1 hypothetical protein [Streptomyces sp. MNU76]